MKRFARLAISFALALVVAPFLPLFIERTLLRSWRVDRLSDQIDWGWKIVSLREYWSDYTYITREQSPAFWLMLNLALAVLYALIFAIVVDRIFAWRTKHRIERSPA